MKISPHFNVQEFIDPVTYAEKGDASAAMIDSKLIACCELLRTKLGKPVIINTWSDGGQYKESGLRRIDSPTGAKRSQHKLGKAADVKVPGLTAQEVRNFIKLHWAEFKSAGLTTIEKDTPTWTHMDVRYTGLNTLYEVPYK